LIALVFEQLKVGWLAFYSVPTCYHIFVSFVHTFMQFGKHKLCLLYKAHVTASWTHLWACNSCQLTTAVFSFHFIEL